jgi:ketosteroid isomerase-like protein
MIAMGACSPAAVGRPPGPPVDWRSFAATSGGPSQGVPTPRERDVADAYLAALASPKLAQLVSRLDEDAHGCFSGRQGVFGRQPVVALHELLFGAFDDRRFVPSRVLATAKAQALEWTMTGLQARDWMGVAATQRPVAFKGISLLWTNDDGTIRDAHIYFDVAVVKGQLGSGPKELLELPPPRTTYAEQRLEQAGTPAEMGNVAAVRAEIGALDALDETAYLSSMTDDVEVYTPERSEPMRGKAAARAYYEGLDHAMAQLDTSILNVWGIASFVVVEYSMAGMQRGPMDRMPLRRNHVVGLHVVDIAELRDGRIARIRRYDNLDELAIDEP